MAVTIREYWQNLKTEYETAYKVSIFSDYNVLMQYAERFGSYLRGLMQEHPLDVDVMNYIISSFYLSIPRNNSYE